jgi:hypothetical protein
LIAWAHHGDGQAVILRRAVLKVENSSHPEPLCGMFFGAGCITQGIEFFHSRVQKLGLSVGPAHLLIFARFLLGLARWEDALVAPVSAAIRADRADMAQGDYLLMLISTLDRLILGLRPFWAQDDNPLHLTAVSAGFRHLFRGALPAMAQGHRNRYTSPENGYVSVNAREIRLDMDGAFAIDGELFRRRRSARWRTASGRPTARRCRPFFSMGRACERATTAAAWWTFTSSWDATATRTAPLCGPR